MTNLQLPIELVGTILEHAVRATIDTTPVFATALQLVSHTTRDWLLPIIYNVLTVHWPQQASATTRSFAFLQRLVTEKPCPAVRAHVHHIVFVSPHAHALDAVPIPLTLDEWPVESVAISIHEWRDIDLLIVIQRLSLRPRRLFFDTGGQNRAFVLGTMFRSWPLVIGIGPAMQTYLQTCLQVVHTDYVLRNPIETEATIRGITDTVNNGPVRQFLVTMDWNVNLYVSVDVGDRDHLPLAAQLVVALLRSPGLSVTLVLESLAISRPIPSIPVAATDVVSTWELLQALRADSALAAGSPLRDKIKFVSAQVVGRPRTSLEYAALVRSGLRSDSPGLSFDTLDETLREAV